MLYQVWRWSAMKQKWVVFGEPALLPEARKIAAQAKTRFDCCCTAIEHLFPGARRKQIE
jgi:hypothetical protein